MNKENFIGIAEAKRFNDIFAIESDLYEQHNNMIRNVGILNIWFEGVIYGKTTKPTIC